jgi:predicted DNA-binding transcriptional regulator
LADAGDGENERERRKSRENVLVGTTLTVYRYLYKVRKPLGIRDVQKGLELSSPSVAQYHIRKLLQAGLVKEEDGGYVVDTNVFENVIRIRRSVIPVQVAYSVFFATLLVALFVLFRSEIATPLFIFASIAITLATILFAYQAVKSRNYPLR